MKSADVPTPRDVYEFYQDMLTTLEFSRGNALTMGEQSPYFTWSEADLDSHFAALAAELRQGVVLLLAASFEALFQADYLRRVKARKKDPVTAGLRRLSVRQRGRTRRRVELDQILDVWNYAKPPVKKSIGEFRQLMEYRHWLAHGRYWNQKSGLRELEPHEAWRRGISALAATGIELTSNESSKSR